MGRASARPGSSGAWEERLELGFSLPAHLAVAGLNCQAMEKAPAGIRMGQGFLQVCSSIGMTVAHARLGAHYSAGLCRFDLLTPISVQIAEERLSLFGFVVAYTYHTMCIPL